MADVLRSFALEHSICLTRRATNLSKRLLFDSPLDIDMYLPNQRPFRSVRELFYSLGKELTSVKNALTFESTEKRDDLAMFKLCLLILRQYWK